MATFVKGMCNYCGVGCSVQFSVEDDGSVKKVIGNPTYSANQGKLCPKGFKLMDPINAADRGTSPLIRDRDGTERAVDWEEAFESMCSRFKKIQAQHGSKSVAFLSTGQMFVEEFALLGLLRGVMDIEGDGNTRQCMASAAVGYKQAFGFDAPPFTYQDIEESDCILIIGSNTAVSHPIIWERYKKNKHDHDLIVIDPRKTAVSERASLHMRIKPKRDLILLYTLANALIQSGKILDEDFIRNHTNDFEDFKKFVSRFDKHCIEETTDIPLKDFEQLVETMETRKRISFWWTMGVNQSHMGTRTGQAIINLALMTGNIGKLGTGPNSITGQTNAMGSRIYSNTTCLFGGRDYANPAHRKQISNILDLPDHMIPATPSMPYDKIIDSVENGSIKALWIICTNPLHSWINSNKIIKAFSNLELLVVQDLYPDTATSKKADIYLPAAGISEKEGTLINSERRIGYSPKVKAAPGKAMSDYQIFYEIAKTWGVDSSIMERWETVGKAFELIKAMSAEMPCDITGIESHAFIMENDGIQWPYPLNNDFKNNSRRLFEDGKFFTGNGRANFLFAEWTAPKQEPDKDYPLYLLTGRGSMAQFHTMTRTGRSESLSKIFPNRAFIELHADDARKYGLEDDELVKVVSRQGKHQAHVKISDAILKGHIFSPMHFLGINLIVPEDFDEFSREPSFKTGAVRLEKM